MRDQNVLYSKPNPQVPWERKYLAGWGYVLSRDVAKYIAATVLRYERFPSSAPGWWRGLHWEDVMVGLLAGDYIGEQPTVRCPALNLTLLSPRSADGAARARACSACSCLLALACRGVRKTRVQQRSHARAVSSVSGVPAPVRAS